VPPEAAAEVEQYLIRGGLGNMQTPDDGGGDTPAP